MVGAYHSGFSSLMVTENDPAGRCCAPSALTTIGWVPGRRAVIVLSFRDTTIRATSGSAPMDESGLAALGLIAIPCVGTGRDRARDPLASHWLPAFVGFLIDVHPTVEVATNPTIVR